MKTPLLLPCALLGAGLLAVGGCRDDAPQSRTAPVIRESSVEKPVLDLRKQGPPGNPAAYIPAQCYTKTQDDKGLAHNPCYTCHINSKSPNFMNDLSLQASYDFAGHSLENHWSNLFLDRSQAVAEIDDEEIRSYVAQSNYQGPAKKLKLAERLRKIPAAWDVNDNGKWDGYTPDCWFDFDEEGFDRTPSGEVTRWRAFAYTPFPGTFWPTNGSTDDVLIRLPEIFWKDEQGTLDRDVAKLNHSIIEALIKQSDVAIAALDERVFGVDLDGDGTLSQTSKVAFLQQEVPTYDFVKKTYSGHKMSYVGAAKEALKRGELHLEQGLYPVGTEFLHSVRYLDTSVPGEIALTPRMKELRYARKWQWNNWKQHKNFAEEEAHERTVYPDVARRILGNAESGLKNGTGWIYQGFIEDREGELRPQTFEETSSCMGCHSTIGAVADSTFVFQRKLGMNAPQEGWYHWGQSGLKGVAEPMLPDGKYEYSEYLRHNGAGDEFRANEEVQARFFANGELKDSALAELHGDISTLLFPSEKRALTLNKAYRVIVQEQSYTRGREAHVKPVVNVHRKVKSAQPTHVTLVKRERSVP